MASATDSHNFLSKSQILDWLNSTLDLSLAKVEDTHNGAVACQIMDAIHRSSGGVSLERVDFNARTEYDMIQNYKVLQSAFDKYQVTKNLDKEIPKLIKGKPLDNLEFMQWFKFYFDKCTSNSPITDYDGSGRRASTKTGTIKKMGVNSKLAGGAGGKLQGAAGRNIPTTVADAGGRSVTPAVAAKAGAASAGSGGGGAIAARPASTVPPPPRPNDGVLAAELAEARGVIDLLDKEKTFYYSKLRDIELLCQTPKISDVPIMKKVETVLYAPTAEEGRQRLIEAQMEFAGRTFLEEDEAAAQAEAEAAEAAAAAQADAEEQP